MQTELRTPSLVDTNAELAEVARALADEKTYYLDTEFESVRAGTTLSVVQVSAGKDIFLVDALRLGNLQPLGRVVSRPGVTWVLHAGLQDLELLREHFRPEQTPRLFDTQIAWGLLGPEPSVSLAYLKFRLLGLRSMKSHQADDWMRRPLPESQLRYAASDIAHLPALYERLTDRAEVLGRLDAIEEASREFLLPVSEDSTRALTLATFRNAWQLDAPSQAALRFLIDWYGELPKQERSLNPKTLLAIASRHPKRSADLARIKGVSDRLARRHGHRLVEGIKSAVFHAKDADFVPIDPAPYATWDDIRIEGWLAFARAEVSAAAQVAPELGFNGQVMRALRDAVEEGGRAAGASALTGWRSRLLAPAYLELCEKFHS